MKILITETGYLVESHEVPKVGHRYILEDAEEYTPPMRRLWESLVEEWHVSGLWDFVDTMDKWKFREAVKLRYGMGFDRIIYVQDGKMVEVKTKAEIPDEIALAYAKDRDVIRGVLRSTTTYTKKMFGEMIDNTVTAMQDAGVDTPKFRDIIETITEVRG